MTAANNKLLTIEGYEKFKKELEYLKSVKRSEIAQRIESAKDMGDLSENAEYAQAREDQAFTEGRIAELEHLLRTATVAEANGKKDEVSLGSKIRVKYDSSEKEFVIVGSNEADPTEGKISHESPIGQAFLGRRVGEAIQVEVPRGIIEYTILEII